MCYWQILLRKLFDVRGCCLIIPYIERLMPNLAVIGGVGLRFGLPATRLDWSGLRPMARQIAARGRLCAGAACPACRWPVAGGALYGHA